MKTNLLSKLTKNLALKIISVVIAIVIWYVVVDFNDPIETESYSVRIEVTNESIFPMGSRFTGLRMNIRRSLFILRVTGQS